MTKAGDERKDRSWGKVWGLEVEASGEALGGARTGPRGMGLERCERQSIDIGEGRRESGRGQESCDRIWVLANWLPTSPRVGPARDPGSLSLSFCKEEGPRSSCLGTRSCLGQMFPGGAVRKERPGKGGTHSSL